MVKRIRIQERDERILRHIHRFRMTTVDVLHRLFFAGNKPEAVNSTVRRLREGDFIQSAELHPPKRCYYHLTAKATQFLGIPKSLARPLGEQALPTRFAVLRFCCDSDTNPHLLRPEEFAAEFAEYQAESLPNEPYYIQESGEIARLGFIVVDLGADAGRIIRKCRKAIVERSNVKAFQTLIRQDAFQITILTGRESKRAAILAAKQRAEDFTGNIEAFVVADLVKVI